MASETQSSIQPERARPLKAIVVHSCSHVVESLRESCECDGRITVVADCLSAIELADAIRRHDPDIVLLGLTVPGIEALNIKLKGRGVQAFAIDDRDPCNMAFCD